MKITVEWLKENGACDGGIRYFKRIKTYDVMRVIKRLRRDRKENYRAWLAVNLNNKKALEELSKDKSEIVRRWLVNNGNLGIKALIRLCKDWDVDIAYTAKLELAEKRVKFPRYVV